MFEAFLGAAPDEAGLEAIGKSWVEKKIKYEK